MLLRGSKNNEKPPCHLSSAPPLQPSPSVSPSALSSLPFPSFGPSPPPFSVSPTPSESHHTDSEAEISHRTSASGMGVGRLLCGTLILPVTFSLSSSVNTVHAYIQRYRALRSFSTHTGSSRLSWTSSSPGAYDTFFSAAVSLERYVSLPGPHIGYLDLGCEEQSTQVTGCFPPLFVPSLIP